MKNNMIRQIFGIIVFMMMVSVSGSSQELGAGLGYQMTLIRNPGLTGSEGSGLIRLSYLNYYPGYNYDLHFISLSYDGYFPSLHGGAGFFLTNDYLGGIVNNIQGGFSYSYFFQAGKDLFISAGLSASIYHRGYNIGNAILPDQIDPAGMVINPSGEFLSDRGTSLLDLSTGMVFFAGNLTGGIAVSHLTRPETGNSPGLGGRLDRSLLFHLAGEINISSERNLKLRPLGKFEVENNFFSGGAGAVLESNYLSVSSILLYDNENNFDIQTGFSLQKGTLMVSYNYRFNVFSGSNMMPFSILHQTGIALILNNIEKRKTVKTINFPKL